MYKMYKAAWLSIFLFFENTGLPPDTICLLSHPERGPKLTCWDDTHRHLVLRRTCSHQSFEFSPLHVNWDEMSKSNFKQRLIKLCMWNCTLHFFPLEGTRRGCWSPSHLCAGEGSYTAGPLMQRGLVQCSKSTCGLRYTAQGYFGSDLKGSWHPHLRFEPSTSQPNPLRTELPLPYTWLNVIWSVAYSYWWFHS